MRVVVTRPANEARRWESALAAAGHQVLSLPLIDIGPASDTTQVTQAWDRLTGMRSVMFVSGNAVSGFFELRPASSSWPTGRSLPRAWAPGPGTAGALIAAGVGAALIDTPDPASGQFDSEALWQVVREQIRADDQVLIVRGSDGSGQSAGRDWLADQLHQAGAGVTTVVAYQRRCPIWGVAERSLARQASDGHATWLFSSSEAISHLRHLLPGANWSGSSAVATHPRIARAASDAGFGVVRESRPTLEAVLAALESSG